jgi:aminoglycoside phosphotransferase (APT) family kinase protein
MTEPDLLSIASGLAGIPATSVTPASNGGNSRVYKAIIDGKPYALKQYPDIANDPRDRLNTERHALELMHWHGTHSVPQWFAANPPYVLMSWVEGEVISNPKEQDIDEAAIFLGTLHHISKKTPAEDMTLASESCLSGQAIVDQLEARVASLMPYTKENPALMAFLSKTFLPTFTKRFMAAKKLYPDFGKELPHEQRTLIAADFGFHNIMRTPEDRLFFIDFEYFGWDDPAKLMADFLLHPATCLSEAMRKSFHNHTLSIYGDSVAPRFAAYYPLFGLRWTLILLNEFLPVRWQARVSAGNHADWGEVKTAQLAKAEAMLQMSEKFA